MRRREPRFAGHAFASSVLPVPEDRFSSSPLGCARQFNELSRLRKKLVDLWRLFLFLTAPATIVDTTRLSRP
jgi:hypothetical protein